MFRRLSSVNIFLNVKFPEQFRILGDPGGPGQFCWVYKNPLAFFCQASNTRGWEHVSVSLKRTRNGKLHAESGRCPTWDEMCLVKSKFWDDEETVMQLHPPKTEWVSMHPFVLHLWKPVYETIPRPPAILVGIPGMNKQKL
jgi:hypothetical protein